MTRLQSFIFKMVVGIPLALLGAHFLNSQYSTAPPAAPSTPMVIALSPLGQKTFENIQLRFQLLQHDIADLERSELAQHPEINPKDYRLDANRGQLVRFTPVPEAKKPEPKSNVPAPAPPAPASPPKPELKK